MTSNHLVNVGIVALLLLSLSILGIGQKDEEKVTADSALAELKSGNAHHVEHRYQHPHATVNRRRQLASGQNPHAEILSCSDSRVPPELIFDVGLGDCLLYAWRAMWSRIPSWAALNTARNICTFPCSLSLDINTAARLLQLSKEAKLGVISMRWSTCWCLLCRRVVAFPATR